MNSRHFDHVREISGTANLQSMVLRTSRQHPVLPGHSLGSRISTELDADLSRIKEAAVFSEVNKDKCYEADKALGLSADGGKVGSYIEEGSRSREAQCRLAQEAARLASGPRPRMVGS